MTADSTPTRARILRAFAETYADDPTVAVETVAERAGVSRSTVYRHFATAADMLEAIRQEALAAGAKLIEVHLAPSLRGDPGADLVAGTIALLDAVFHGAMPHGELLRRDIDAEARIQEHFGRLADEVVRRAQRQGTIAAHLDPAAIYVASVALCRGLLISVEAGEVTPEAASSVAAAFFGALRP